MLVRLDVRGQIGEMEVAIAIDHRLVHPAEKAEFRRTESIGRERINYAADPRIGIVNLARLEAARLPFGDLLSRESKYVHVLSANFLENLDVGAIERRHRERSVHR